MTPIAVRPLKGAWSEGQIALHCLYRCLLGCRAAGQHLALGVSHRLLVVSLSDRRGQLGLKVLLRVGEAVAAGASKLGPQWALEALTQRPPRP